MVERYQYSLAVVFVSILLLATFFTIEVGYGAGGAIFLSFWSGLGLLTYWAARKSIHCRRATLFAITIGTVGGAATASVDRWMSGPDPLFPSALISHLLIGTLIGSVIGAIRGMSH